MDGKLKRGGDACCKLLDLIPKERSLVVQDGGGGHGFRVAEERKLELRLGPPGEDWLAVKKKTEEHPVEPARSLLYFSGISKSPTTNSNPSSVAKWGFLGGSNPKTQVFEQQQHQHNGFLQAKAAGLNGRAEQQECCLERKPCCPPPSTTHASAARNAVVNNSSSQTRIESTPVVGWPPIRSFRKNLAATSKPSLEAQKGNLEAATKVECGRKGMFVKINMDGIPIGRKVDLKAYDSYEMLSLAVDELFCGLLSAQRDSVADGTHKKSEEKQGITGLLDGSGEYILVYEDDEGDRMLVGDIPWNMFISTAKRLRVLKSSELSILSMGAVSRKRAATEC